MTFYLIVFKAAGVWNGESLRQDLTIYLLLTPVRSALRNIT
jgi:hypothetical protein